MRGEDSLLRSFGREQRRNQFFWYVIHPGAIHHEKVMAELGIEKTKVFFQGVGRLRVSGIRVLNLHQHLLILGGWRRVFVLAADHKPQRLLPVTIQVKVVHQGRIHPVIGQVKLGSLRGAVPLASNCYRCLRRPAPPLR